MSRLLLAADATVKKVHSWTQNIEEVVQHGDIEVVAVMLWENKEVSRRSG